MCFVSAIYQHYDPLFPQPDPFWQIPPAQPPMQPQPIPAYPNPIPQITIGTIPGPNPDVAELKQLIADFKEALKAAKLLDKLTKQPDCEDPEKAKLEERVAKLEEAIKKLIR
jgi:hypothetical protein